MLQPRVLVSAEVHGYRSCNTFMTPNCLLCKHAISVFAGHTPGPCQRMLPRTLLTQLLPDAPSPSFVMGDASARPCIASVLPIVNICRKCIRSLL